MWKQTVLLLCLVVCLTTAKHTRNQMNVNNRVQKDSEDIRNRDGSRPRNIIIQNRGKIVNNGASTQSEGSVRGINLETDRDTLLERLGGVANADRNTLLKQKFLLDVLYNVNGDLLDEELMRLGETLVIDESNIVGLIDDDMWHLLQLAIDGRALNKAQVFDIRDRSQVRQLNGLRKLLVQARDWESFQRIVCFARQHLNGALVVSTLVQAVPERVDTKNLVVPAVSEIIPEVFIESQVQRQAQNVDFEQLITDSETLRPGLRDITGIRRTQQGMSTGRWGSPIKKTWQEWRAEKMQRQQGVTHNNLGIRGHNVDLERIVLPVTQRNNMLGESQGRSTTDLSEDLELNSLWYNVIVEALSEQGAVTDRTQVRSAETINRIREDIGDSRLNKWRRLLNSMNRIDEDSNELIERNTNQRNPLNNIVNGLDRLIEKGLQNKGMLKRLGQRAESIQDSTRHTNPHNLGRKTDDISENDSAEVRERQWEQIRRENMLRNRNLRDQNQRVTVGSSEETQNTNRRILERTTDDDSTEAKERQWQQIRRQNMLRDRETVRSSEGTQNNNRRNLGRVIDDLSEIDSTESREQQWNQIRRDNMLRTQSNDRVGFTDRVEGLRDNDRLLHVNRRRLNQKLNRTPMSTIRRNVDESDESSEEIRTGRIRRMVGKVNSKIVRIVKGIQDSSEENIDIGSLENKGITGGHARTSQGSTDIRKIRIGEILLQNLQQIVARLKLERLADIIEEQSGLQVRDTQDKQARKIKDRKRGKNSDVVPTVEYLEAIQRADNLVEDTRNVKLQTELKRIETILRNAIRTAITEAIQLQHQGRVQLENSRLQNIIGEAILDRIGNMNTNVIETILESKQVIREIVNVMERTVIAGRVGQPIQAAMQPLLLDMITRIINEQLETQSSYTRSDLLVDGIAIKDVKVDKLQTTTDIVDNDLINLLDLERQVRTIEDIEQVRKPIVARQRVLQRQDYTINIDVNSERTQNVVVRVLLGPKLEGVDNARDLNSVRQQFIQLDAFPTTLTTGRNIINRKAENTDRIAQSIGITTTTELYRNVLQDIQGETRVPLSLVSRSNCRLPERLRLPRGLPQGLPMQMLVIITPQTTQDLKLRQRLPDDLVCGIGMDTLNLDLLPLGFPMDRPIRQVDDILVPNSALKDVLIHHDE